MLKTQAMPSKYLKQGDIPKPVLVTIQRVALEELESSDDSTSEKPILHFLESISPMVLNATNWDLIEEGLGLMDSDDWGGHQIVIEVDKNVRFQGKRVGGLRVRMPRKPKNGSTQAAQLEPDPEPEIDVDEAARVFAAQPSGADDEVPF